MPEMRKKFKPVPKRFHPKGLTILYEDHDIIVVDKRSGLLTVSTDKVKDKTAYYLLTDYVRKGNPSSKNRVFIVHRIDRETSGVLIFAKSEAVKKYLQEHWKEFTKQYYAVVSGQLESKKGIIETYLAENSAHRMYSTNDPAKGKYAKTEYAVLQENRHNSLLAITLHTGRKNQIRVHLSERGHPLIGDKKYGEKVKGSQRLTLHSASLTITHPVTKEEMRFETGIPPYFLTLLKGKKPTRGSYS